MSWKPAILNREDDKIQRTVREDTTTVEDLVSKGTPNLVKIEKDKFICPECLEGWTFARMKSVVCCGITYVRA